MQPISAPPQPVGGTGLGARIRRHTGQIARLSGPIVVGNTAVLLMEVVDTIMVGRFDTLELAFQGIASVVVFPMLICGIGYMQSTQVAVSNAYGADDLKRCGRALWLSVPVALVLGLVGTLLCLAGGPILLALGQDPEIARGGGEVVAILGLGLPAILLGVTCAGFLDGLGRPIAGMLMILTANLVNVFANWVLIYGNLGFEPMGATGSAWATVIVRWLFVPAMVVCIALLVDRRAFGLDRVGARIAAVFTAEAVAGFWRDSS
ncbi:MAG: MATE family efflux transporter, partial [Pseudomonadota bacterium]